MEQVIKKYQSFLQYLIYTRPFRAPEWFLRKLQYRGLDQKKNILLNMRLGHKIELIPTQSYLERVIYNRAYHDEGTFYLEPFLKEGAVILDIGANIGLLTCAYAQRFKKHSPVIYAVEAVEQNFLKLVRNIDLNGFKNVHPFRLALGEEAGELTFKLPSKDFIGNAVGSNVLSVEDSKTITDASGYQEVVPLVRLDDWARANNVDRCDFMKIDVEGAELSVFRGGREFIKKFRPIIQCEFNRHWLEQQGISIRDFEEFFRPLGYSFFVDSGDEFVPLEAESFNSPLVDLLLMPR